MSGSTGGTGSLLPPPRSLNLADGVRAPRDEGPLGGVPRVAVRCEVLAAATRLGPEAEAGWDRVPSQSWSSALRDAQLLDLLESPTVRAARPDGGSPVGQLSQIRAGLQRVRDLEERLGSRADETGMRPLREVDTLVVGLCLLGVLAALAPVVARELIMIFLLGLGAVSGWRLWGPRPAVTRDELYQARRDVALAIREFLGHTWVVPVGDRVLESMPHAEYLALRQNDLEVARAERRQQLADANALLTRIKSANAQLGLPEEDAETRRLRSQIDQLGVKVSQIEQLCATVSARLEDYRASVERLRAIAARRALSARVANLVEDERGESRDQERAEVEVDVADLESRVRALQVEVSDANADLLAVMEVSALGSTRAR